VLCAALTLILLVAACAALPAHASRARAVGPLSPTATPTPTSPPSPTSASPASPTPLSPTPSSPAPSSLSALRIVALGDSVTAGTHCSCRAFPALYGDGLRKLYDVPVRVDNVGVNGDASADLLAELTGDRDTEADVRAANVVVITIGANDFGDSYDAITTGTCGGDDGLRCVRRMLAALGPRLTALLDRVDSLRGGRPTAVLVTGYWNVFEDGDVAAGAFSGRGRATTDRLTRAADALIAKAAHADNADYVDLYTAFKGAHAERDPTRLLAADGDHPSAAGHRVIAQALLSAGIAPLGSTVAPGSPAP
jgi:lysophospholipase L1-like esterase